MNSVRIEYTNSINKKMLLALVCHLPIAVLLALFFEASIAQAVSFSAIILAGPLLARLLKMSPNFGASINAVAGIMFSALFIHLGKGMIEMHFHIFVFLACLTIYGLMTPIIVATLAVVVHHIGFFFFIPSSLFNYDASFSIVLIHAAFVVVEDIGILYVAKRFGDFIVAQGGSMLSLDEISKSNQDTSGNLSINAQKLSASSQQQAASIAEMTSTLKEVGSDVERNSNSLKQSSELVSSVRQDSVRGKETMDDLEEGVKDINSSVEDLNGIVDLIKLIGDKVLVINDIVFKTQLLSFNASIEAARAGQHGRGFAVVAEEVGQLAHSSGSAAREIESLLSGSDEKVNGIVEKVKQRVSSANQTMGTASHQFENIVQHIKSVEENIHNLTHSNTTIQASVEEFYKALANLEVSSSENTIAAQNVEKLAVTTKEQAEQLLETINDANRKINLKKDIA